MKKRRAFSREYKLEAVKKIVLRGMSYSEVAADLGIRDNLIHNWRGKFVSDGTLAKLTEGDSSSEAVLKRLREVLRQLKMERDILKKATAFFAKESR